MDRQRMARMFEATRLSNQGRFAEAKAVLQQGIDTALPAGRAWPSHRPDVLHRGHVSARRPPPGPLPPGRFLGLSYSNPAGERAYKLYVPARPLRQDAPLFVMLHGGTQGADDFAAGTQMNHLAERNGFLVAYPEQSRTANHMGYWNWFRPTDQHRDEGEPSLIAGLTRRIIETHAVDSSRTYVAGFSAGGAMAAIMAAAYPDLFAAAGVHSGLPAGCAHDLPSAFAAMKQGGRPHRVAAVPLVVFHGDEDPTVNVVNADRLVRAALADTESRERPLVIEERARGGHAYTRRLYGGRAGSPQVEQWTVHGAGHAWSGGSPHGTYTDPQGPDASAELVRFFMEKTLRSARDQAA